MKKRKLMLLLIISFLAAISVFALVCYFKSNTPYSAFVGIGCTASAYEQESGVGYLTIQYDDIDYYNEKVKRDLEVKNANNIMCGYFAFDENYHYFKDITGDNGIYRKDRTTGDIIPLYKLPITITNGFLHSISVWNDRIYFVSSNHKNLQMSMPESDVMAPPVAYSMNIDGTDLKVIVENVGDTCYAVNDTLYYTTYKDSLLHKYNLLTGKDELLIDSQSEHVNITPKGIYYSDGKFNGAPVFYNFTSKQQTKVLEDQTYNPFGSVLQYDDKLYFYGKYPESDGNANEGYTVYDLSTNQATSISSCSKTTNYQFFAIYKNKLLFHTFEDEKSKNESIISYHKKILNAFDGKKSREIFTKQGDTNMQSYQFIYSDGEDLIVFSEGIRSSDYSAFETLPEITTIDLKGKSTAYIPQK